MLEHFPDPYPDEILYSVWARYGALVNYPSEADALEELFGKRQVGPSVDLPGHLQFFVRNLPHGHGYTLDFFLFHHTLLPLYCPFWSGQRLAQIQEHMMKGDKSVHVDAGIANAGGVLSPLWLRYCPLCAKAERAQWGECYWHRLHQAPGVAICPLHHLFLEESTIRARSALREGRLFPAERAIHPVEYRSATSSPYFPFLMNLACDAQYLLEHRFAALDPHFLYHQYGALLAQRGFTTPGGRVRFRDFLRAFTDYYSEAFLATLHCTVKLQGPLDSEWLARITRLHPEGQGKFVCHPLYHLLAIRFLGSTLEAFLQQEFPVPHPFGEGPWPCLNPVCEHYLERTIATYHLGETRVKGQAVGIFSCCCGYTYSRIGPDASPEDAFRKGRTRVYGSVWDKKLRTLWFNGTIRQKDIARLFRVNRYTINRQARRLNLPVPRWNARPKVGGRRPKRKPKGLSRYRSAWLALIKEGSEESWMRLREKAHGVYSWLHRHDREWLDAHSPRKKRADEQKPLTHSKQQPVFNSKVPKRDDARMAEAIKTQADTLLQTPGFPKRMSKARILREILQARYLPPPKAIPFTTQTLQKVIETQEAFALRRIQWVLQQYLEEGVCPTRQQFIARAHFTKILRIQAVQRSLDEALERLSQESAGPRSG
jgi:hypothetical protein